MTDLANAKTASPADAGMAFPADLDGVVTIGVASLGDAGMALPADLAGEATVGVFSLADAGMVTVGAPVDIAGVPEYGISCGDRLSPGVWCRGTTLIQNDLDSQFFNLVRCDLVDMGCTVPPDGYTSSFGTLWSGPMCPVTDDRTHWERLEALGATVMTTLRGLTVDLAPSIMMTHGIMRSGVIE